MSDAVTIGQPDLKKRYNCNSATIWRWRTSKKTGFPPPDMVINGRPRWYEKTILEFERTSTKHSAA